MVLFGLVRYVWTRRGAAGGFKNILVPPPILSINI
jgi:hypothetical protein